MPNGLTKGYTQIGHEVMENVTREDFTKREYKMILWTLRNGYGFKKEQSECDLDAKQIAEDTGIDRSHVWKTLHQLNSKKVLMLGEDKVRFNRHADQWTMAKTATNKVRPKQPQPMAKIATDCGQNSHKGTHNILTDSELPALKEKGKKKETPIPPSNGENESTIAFTQISEQIIAFLNKTIDKSFKPSRKGTQRLIRARLNEGFTVEDFEKVITVKAKHWKGDRKMDGYLRPETLFSNKFEGYLQESINSKSDQQPYGF